jgi:hypothetical protein
MSPASNDASMLAVAVTAPLHPTLLAVDSCTRLHANLLVPGQIVSGLVFHDKSINIIFMLIVFMIIFLFFIKVSRRSLYLFIFFILNHLFLS